MTEQIEQEVDVIEERVDNPVECNIRVGSRQYSGEVEFVPFDFSAWRRWRKAIKNKDGLKLLKKEGYDPEEQDAVMSFWSGAAIIKRWNVCYIEDGDKEQNKVEVQRPISGKLPPEEMDFMVFNWFRRVTNDYVIPRLGLHPKL